MSYTVLESSKVINACDNGVAYHERKIEEAIESYIQDYVGKPKSKSRWSKKVYTREELYKEAIRRDLNKEITWTIIEHESRISKLKSIRTLAKTSNFINIDKEDSSAIIKFL